ncbi:MAG: YceD family protein [Pseudoxanthomonas sp.]
MSTDTHGFGHEQQAVDAWRAVAGRRRFEGRTPLAAFRRLDGLLTDAQGEVAWSLQFDRDALQVACAELRVEAELPLECQRSLRRFLLPVRVVQRLGLLRAGSGSEEADEAALPPDYEALLVPPDGHLRLLDIVEDELVLAVPPVPVEPGSEAVERDWPAQEAELAKANPFAALASLKKN